MPINPSDAMSDRARTERMDAAVSREPIASLPSVRLFAWVLAIGVLLGAAWAAFAAFGPGNGLDLKSGLLGVGVTTLMAIAGVVVMTPWKRRRMGDWMTLWMAATVFRLLGTPVVVYLLYSAASNTGLTLAVKPMVLSVATTYLVVVLAEAGIIAAHVRRMLPSH